MGLVRGVATSVLSDVCQGHVLVVRVAGGWAAGYRNAVFCVVWGCANWRVVPGWGGVSRRVSVVGARARARCVAVTASNAGVLRASGRCE